MTINDLNWQDALNFLTYLATQADKHTFQVFPERGRRAEQIIDRRLMDVWPYIQHVNRTGSGVSVMVNELAAGDTRSGEHIRRVRAIWLDDDGHAAPVDKLPLAPGLSVESSPGRFHHYWLVSDEWIADLQGREDFTLVMRSIVDLYGSDPQAVDIGRAMRLPGTWNNKYETPFLARLLPVPVSGPVRYTRAEILAAFVGDTPPAKAPAPIEEPQTEPVDLRRLASALRHIPADGRAEWLSVGMALHHGTYANHDAFQLWDDWSQTTLCGNYDPKEQRRAWTSFRHELANPKTVASVYALAMEHGWVDDREASSKLPITRVEPIRLGHFSGGVADSAIDAVRQKFANYGHRPSDEQIDDLHQIALGIEHMAQGSLPSEYLLSYLPPGTGKTSIVIETVKALCLEPAYAEIGVIIFLSRLEEIQKLAHAMNLGDNFAVIVSEGKPENKLGRQYDKTKARVLFTTQEGLRVRGKDGALFADMDRLFFNGRPRQVRIWDEAITPSRSITVSRNDLSELFKPFRDWGQDRVADDLEKLFAELNGIADGSIVSVPDLTGQGITIDEARSLFPKDRWDIVEPLIKLSGQRVRVRHGKTNREVMLSYEDALPADLSPMVILDASGEFRQTYQFWRDGRSGLSFLSCHGKTYDGMTIHHWDRAAGRAAYAKDYQDIAKGVARTINIEIPENEPVLVVHFLPNKYLKDMSKAISDKIKGNREIYYLTWGKHTATNDFHMVKYVILAGILQYSIPENEAAGRGAKGINVDDDFSLADLAGTRLGEIAHNVFQAACRGYVRHSEGDSCPQGCHLYMIFSSHPQAGVPRSLLNRVFPGSTVVDWRPIQKLTARQKELAGLIAEKAHESWPYDAQIPKAELSQGLGVRAQRMTELLNDDLSAYLLNEEGVKITIETRKVIALAANRTGALASPTEEDKWFVLAE